MHKITMPTTLRPVQIARLLEREGSPLAPLAEEIYDLAMFYRIDAAFALAQCMVESKLGCTLAAQANRSAALVPLAVARMAAPKGALSNRFARGAAGAASARPRPTFAARDGGATSGAAAGSASLRAGEGVGCVVLPAIPILPPRYGDEYGTGYVTYPSWLTGLEEYLRILRLIFVDAWREERVEDVARAFLASAPNRRGPAQARQGALTTRSPEVIAYARRVERYRRQFQAEASAAPLRRD